MANFTLSASLDVMADTGVDIDEAKRKKIAEQRKIWQICLLVSINLMK